MYTLPDSTILMMLEALQNVNDYKKRKFCLKESPNAIETYVGKSGYTIHYDTGVPKPPMNRPVFSPQRTQSGWDKNRIAYQKLKDRACKCTDTSVNLNDYEIVEYVVGNKFRKHNGLTWNHFDWASPAGDSFNPTNQQKRYHFVCWRDKVQTVINAVKIKRYGSKIQAK